MRNRTDENDSDEIAMTDETDAAHDDVDLADEEAHAESAMKRLREKLRVCHEEKAAALEEVHRARADFLNARKNLAAQAARDTERAVEQLLVDLLPLCDSFTEAMRDTATWESVAPEWRRGMLAIHQQLQQLLERYDVTAVNPMHEPFDPALHEALASEPSEHESDTVITVIQLGYLRNGTVIRPAKVIISQ